ncbi:hypothetical protein Nepgr_004156 [Nepenthes gracilis]|uniref:Uncharacterized protein n=1 Tax=Nepenthes gracilis TaxID=150966 RepID=A0AAD3S103_NEPGR|nr:hypothetical protein Nepgr_004156 [Nepenthes gracilis]
MNSLLRDHLEIRCPVRGVSLLHGWLCGKEHDLIADYLQRRDYFLAKFRVHCDNGLWQDPFSRNSQHGTSSNAKPFEAARLQRYVIHRDDGYAVQNARLVDQLTKLSPPSSTE